MKKDMIFKKVRKTGDFVFNKEVCSVFDDMLERSVPFYHEMQQMAAGLVKTYSIENSNIYDLGCSTGNTMLKILKNNKKGYKSHRSRFLKTYDRESNR